MTVDRWKAPERLVTTQQIAEMLGVSKASVQRMTRDGMPSRLLMSRTRRYYVSECIAWVDANCHPGQRAGAGGAEEGGES